MADLTLDGVTKHFDDDGDPIVAVDDVSIDINDGEFLVLVGPSGCGKSTTLRMIAGLETVTSGTISLGETSISGLSPPERDIAMVFQSYALYPHMTVRENMSFGLEESTDLPDSEIKQVVTDTVEMLDIDELIDRKPEELSGGQQQRVALGRAIVRDPSAFLMDEPLSNLDAKLRAQMRTELQRLQDDLAVTTVYVTHDQTEAMTMGDRIAILDDGQLQQVGTPLECYHEPKNLFVADFIGEPSMNFFEMERQGTRLVGEDFEYSLSADTVDELDDQTDLTLGIRPEDISLVSSAETSQPHDFETAVDVVEPRGDENSVYLTFEDQGDEYNTSKTKTFVASVSGLHTVDSGQAVTVRLPEDAIHLFGPSGVALRNRQLDEVKTTEPQIS
jgi:multiple sugar transport system ATP-binding protein